MCEEQSEPLRQRPNIWCVPTAQGVLHYVVPPLGNNVRKNRGPDAGLPNTKQRCSQSGQKRDGPRLWHNVETATPISKFEMSLHHQ